MKSFFEFIIWILLLLWITTGVGFDYSVNGVSYNFYSKVDFNKGIIVQLDKLTK